MRLIFDLEANGLMEEVDKIWCIVAYDLDEKVTHTFTDHVPNQKPLKDGIALLESADVLIGHNIIMYDMPVLKKITGKTFNARLVDTFLLSQLLDFNRKLKYSVGRHGLANWGEYFGVPKPEQNQWLVWENNMLHRCVEDVRINIRVYNQLVKEQKKVQIPKRSIEREMDVAKISAIQVENGWLFDKELAKEHVEFLDDELERIAELVEPLLPKKVTCKDHWVTNEECNDLLCAYDKKRFPMGSDYESGNTSGKKLRKPKTKIRVKSGKLHSNTCKDFEIEPDSNLVGGPYTRVGFEDIFMSQTAQVKNFLLTQGWKPTQWNYKINEDGDKEKTSPKLTEDSYDSIDGELGRNIALHAIYRHRRNTISNIKDDSKGWLGVMRDDSRVECVPFTLGTATGRMSHRKLVNVPGVKSTFGKEMRELFTAPEGMVLVGCDLSSAQLRLLASAMEDDDYSEVVLTGKEDEGTDIHTVNGVAAGLIDPKWPLDSKARANGRSNSKTFIYAMLFGSGDAKIGTIVGGNSRDGRKLKNKFLNSLPSLGALLSNLRVEYKTSNDKYIKLQDKRKIQVDSAHKILNYRLQGDEAILTKEWMCVSSRRILEEGIRCKLLAVMHDEQNFECHPDDSKKLAKLLEDSATEAGRNLGFNCRMDGNSKIGKNWYEIH